MDEFSIELTQIFLNKCLRNIENHYAFPDMTNDQFENCIIEADPELTKEQVERIAKRLIYLINDYENIVES
ncbi:MAG: hypothetical protein J1F35_08390 [Erysipelotrichales bacterium]|nr:hypothetical protein [Erysipelotrichales bacterium]